MKARKILSTGCIKLFNAWCELGEYENSTEGISEMVIKDVYFRSQPIQVQTHLKEMGRMSLREMAQKAEYYREAHNIHGMKEEYNDRRGYKLWQSRSGEYEVGRNRTDMHERRNGTDTYRFTVNPFGLRNAGAVYCRLMRMIMQGANNVGNYVDDVIAHDKNVDCHIDTLRNLFQRLREANVKVKPSKARLGYFKLEFLGFVVGNGEIKPTETNIKKIQDAPRPTTKKGVRALCGAINFVRKFIPNCAEIIRPITELTKRDGSETVKWETEQELVFTKIKQILTSDPVLKLFDIKKEHMLQTDASEIVVGGTLLQKEADGTLHPVFYVSRKLLPRETRYTVTEREALAVVWALTKLYRYLYGRHFEIMFDHEALSLLNSSKLSVSPRVIRWQLFLQTFDFTLRFVEKTKNGLADYLSRLER